MEVNIKFGEWHGRAEISNARSDPAGRQSHLGGASNFVHFVTGCRESFATIRGGASDLVPPTCIVARRVRCRNFRVNLREISRQF